MYIANSPAVPSAVTATQLVTTDVVITLVLKKTIDLQISSAAILLQAIPQPALANQVPLGTKVNTFA